MPTRTAAFAVLAALAAAPAPALAAEGESALSLGAGYATYYTQPAYNPHGGVLAMDFERGFSDALSWRLSGGVGAYYRDGVTYSGHLTAGLTYLFDVLKYVPYVNAGIGGIAIAGGDRDAELSALVELGAGLDLLRSRTFSYGVYLRFETLLQETSFFTAGVRATWRWGFF